MAERVHAPFSDLRLGLFVHYVFYDSARRYRGRVLGQHADGTPVADLDELADGLDVNDLAACAGAMRAEYLIFTAWHANMNVLYPSRVLRQMRPGHASRRDVIRDLLNALRPRGVRLFLYVHPCDGDDFPSRDQKRLGWNDGAPYARWNRFVSRVCEEICRRYAVLQKQL